MRLSNYIMAFGLLSGIAEADTAFVAPDTTVNRMHYKKQQHPTACGNTCLAMLGYDRAPDMGYFVSPDSLKTIVPDVTEVEYNGKKRYDTPHMIVIAWKDSSAINQNTAGGKNDPYSFVYLHWVVGYGDSIYCPIKGVLPFEEYMKRYVSFVTRDFSVPFA